MSRGDFTVDPEQLRGHAGRLAGHADRLAATGARLPDALGEQSLGSFAGFLTAGLSGAMATTLDAFGHVAAAVDQVGGGLRQVADQYQRTDDDSSAVLTGIETEVAEW
ncbi:WXG100 family type VII secretion target [Saccharothrix sp. 6-C]|uniref:WXG100 family type VII secretion target n=1 Tax=Saccharothrix sp. 6-C TaxID=2781735 RepID=UPI001916D906|nr:type VII secretion target [Saccharothrix sp. 6-C]QQQ79622.1 WXG100 family type VII secretion target [Saccharothrix sp. 6-C]